MQPNDAILGTLEKRLADKGINPNIIQMIIQALMSLLGGVCPTPPTPATVTEALDRKVVDYRLRNRMYQYGVPASQLPVCALHVKECWTEATDAERTAFLAAAQEVNS